MPKDLIDKRALSSFEFLYLGFSLKDLANVTLSPQVLKSALCVGQVLAIGHKSIRNTAFKDTPKISVSTLMKYPKISASHVHKINLSWRKNSMCIPDELYPRVRRKLPKSERKKKKGHKK